MAALQKSCVHLVSESFRSQEVKFQASGYPQHLVNSVCHSLIKEVKKWERGHRAQEATSKNRRMAFIPYVYGLAHNLKHVGNRYSVDVKFTARNKLACLCPRINKPRELSVCPVRHRGPSRCVECVLGVVCVIPVSCGGVCIGRSGGCADECLVEHHASLRASARSRLAVHCRGCGCHPVLHATEMLFGRGDRATREIVEAFHVGGGGRDCVGRPSILLHGGEFEFLDG
uniref:Tick transposon n=1 Tax=Rhipicephalus zambeziensis TaxID=60191 RepID=A0A224Z189_9ACAR